MNRTSSLLFVLVMSLYGVLFAQNTALHNPQADYPGSPEKALTASIINELYTRNSNGQILEAWQLLAAQKDGYAHSAVKIFGKKITVEKCVVLSNWEVVVGKEVRNRLYEPYAKLYQKSYIDFLNDNHRYPNSLEIEKLYRNADDALGLPQSVSVDLLLNAVPADWKKRIFFDDLSTALGIGRAAEQKRWYDYTKLSPARVTRESIAADNVNAEQAKAIYRKTTKVIAKCMLKKLKANPAPAAPSYEQQ